MVEWTVGRKKRAAPSPLLSSDTPGPQSPRFAASRLAGICSRHQSHYRGRKRLTGSQKFYALAFRVFYRPVILLPSDILTENLSQPRQVAFFRRGGASHSGNDEFCQKSLLNLEGVCFNKK
jgi:hypothetical protein